MFVSWAAVMAQDVVSPCPGWEGKGISANSEVFLRGWAGPSALSSTRSSSSSLTPAKRCSFSSATPSLHPIQTLESLPAPASQQLGQVVFREVMGGGELTQGGQDAGQMQFSP